MDYKYYPSEIAETLCMLAGAENSIDEGIRNDCEEALYYLVAVAENPYNHESFRTMWKVLQQLAERHDNGDILDRILVDNECY